MPYICKVYEVGEVEGKAYIAMQFIDGPSLQQAAGQLAIGEKAQIIRDAAQALHAAHELGIVHRDIKPATGTSEAQIARTVPRRGQVLAGPALGRGTAAMTLPLPDGRVGRRGPEWHFCHSRTKMLDQAGGSVASTPREPTAPASRADL